MPESIRSYAIGTVIRERYRIALKIISEDPAFFRLLAALASGSLSLRMAAVFSPEEFQAQIIKEDLWHASAALDLRRLVREHPAGTEARALENLVRKELPGFRCEPVLENRETQPKADEPNGWVLTAKDHRFLRLNRIAAT